MEASYRQRSDMAQQFRRWGVSQNLPQLQLDQMLQEIMAGSRDAEILTAARANATQQPTQPNIASPNPGLFGEQPPFNNSMQFGGNMQFPAMPSLPGLPPMPQPQMGMMLQMPVFPSMAQPFGSQNPGPGMPAGQAFQQFAQDPAHQLRANFCYTRSIANPQGSSSVHIAQNAGQPATMTANQWPPQPATPVIVHSSPRPAPVQPRQPQSALAPYQQPYQPQQPAPAASAARAPQPPRQQAHYRAPRQPPQEPSQPSQEPYHFHFHEPNPEPQNSRLTNAFKRQLSEETYFSTPPGATDRCVEKRGQ